MPRSKTLRKELKEQARDELNQKDEKIQNVQNDCMDVLYPCFGIGNNIPPIPMKDLMGKRNYDKNDRSEMTISCNFLLISETRREVIHHKRIAMIEGRLPPNVSHEESDQRPVKGSEAIKLFIDLSTGLDYSPVYPHLSDWLRTIYCGDYEKFLGFLHGLSEDEVKILVSKRESLYNISAIFHVVRGALNLTSDLDHPVQQVCQNALRNQLVVKDGYMKIFVKLLCLGVDVNERDAFGQTPLFYCIGDGEVIPKMAQRLIKAGAKVNAQDRRGKTPLHYHAGSSYIEVMQLLLANGADPHIKDNDGDTVYDMHSTSIAKDIIGGFDKNRAMEARKMSRDALGGSFRQCGVCYVGVGKSVMKRCTGKKQ